MTIIDKAKKMFIGGEWFVGYKEKDTSQYRIISVKEGWIADPFLYEYNGEHYLFVEYVKKSKGEIACYKFVQGEPVFQQVVISEPYHLSYPCVFSHENDIYMIPESADNRTINLYKCISFPNKWEKVKELHSGVYYDTTYVQHKGKDYLISYSPKFGYYTLEIFSFDIRNLKIELIAEHIYKINIGRPAGGLFERNNILIRPAQDCERKYGEKIFLYKVVDFGQEVFHEQLLGSISAGDTNLPFQRIHTYNFDSTYEVVDFFKERFEPFRSFGILSKLLKQRLG